MPEMTDLLRRCRRSVELDMKAHERIAQAITLGPASRQLHEIEAQKLHDVLLEIDEVLKERTSVPSLIDLIDAEGRN